MTWDTTKAWFKHSVTIAWARFLVVGGTALELAAQAADLLQAAGVGTYVPPRWVGAYTITIGIITELARRRSLGRPTS